jgi:hypothetical protein
LSLTRTPGVFALPKHRPERSFKLEFKATKEQKEGQRSIFTRILQVFKETKLQACKGRSNLVESNGVQHERHVEGDDGKVRHQCEQRQICSETHTACHVVMLLAYLMPHDKVIGAPHPTPFRGA